jgi:hypothetical protein
MKTDHPLPWPIARVALVAAIACLAGLLAATPARAQQATCPGTFEVLHDDRIGALSLPAGHYTITVLDSARLSCASASDLFRQFLEDYDGKLQRGWRLNASTATFTRGSVGFRVAQTATPSGAGGGGRHPSSGTTCPGYFTVEHDDRIGALRLPAGQYRITLLASGTLSCAGAASQFARFLQDFDGRLPRPWTLDASTGTFQSGYHVGFRVKEAVGTAPSRTPAGTHPSDGTRCPGTFRVQNDDRIGALRLPAGPYVITARGLSCSSASSTFARFLDLPAGNLPSPWALNAATGTFSRGGGTSFRVDPTR